MSDVHHQSSPVCPVPRGSGKSSAVAHAAYVEATMMRDEREGLTWSYSEDADRVAGSAVMLPAGAPEAWRDPEVLWNENGRLIDDRIDHKYRNQTEEFRVEKKAKYRDHVRGMISFKTELGPEKAMEITKALLHERFVRHGHAVHLVVHREDVNLHVHFMATSHRVNEDGTLGTAWKPMNAKPYRDDDGKWRYPLADWTRDTKAMAADMQNAALVEMGLGHIKVEHRSFAEMGVNLAPTQHEGTTAHAIESKGKRSHIRAANAAVRTENSSRVDSDPWMLVKKLNATNATFTAADLDREIAKTLGNDETLIARARASILADQRLAVLGEDARGNTRFSTTDYVQAEAELFRTTERLAGRAEHRGDAGRFAARLEKAEAAQGWKFSAQQRAVMSATVDGSDLTLIVGRAGAGKTTIMKQVSGELTDAGYRVRGVALAGKAADNLWSETGVKAQTVDSLLTVLQHRDEARDSARRGDPKSAAYLEATADQVIRRGDVVILDEAGMVDVRKMRDLLQRVEQAGAKAIVVGDPDQLAAIGAGSAMRGMLERGDFLELDEIFRQKDPAMRAASQALARGDFAAGIGHYRQSGAVVFADTRDQAKAAIVSQFLADHAAAPDKSRSILAYKNADVDQMNLAIKTALKASGDIGPGHMVRTERGEREISVGDRVVFGENSREIGVYNGSTGFVRSIDRREDGAFTVAVQLDGERGKLVQFDTADYAKIDHAWALTTHKSQGQSIAQTYLLADSDGLLRRDGAYVALTRHTESVRVYGSRQEYKEYEDLVRSFGREPGKDIVADFSASPELRRVRDYVRAADQVTALHREVSSVGPGKKWEDHARFSEYEAAQKERERLAKTIAADWSGHKQHAGNARLTRDSVERHAGTPRPLTEREQEAAQRLKAYATEATQTRDLWNRIKAESPSLTRTREHPDYARYDALRQTRDATAAEIAADRRLYRPLLHVEQVKEAMVLAHARDHAAREKAVAERASMSPERRQAVDLLAAYDTERATLATQYRAMSQAGAKLADQTGFRDWQRASDAADRRASELLTDQAVRDEVAELAGSKRPAAHLDRAAGRHEARATVAAYTLVGSDVADRRLVAAEIGRLQAERPELKPVIRDALKAEGVDLRQLRADQKAAMEDFAKSLVRDYAASPLVETKADAARDLADLYRSSTELRPTLRQAAAEAGVAAELKADMVAASPAQRERPERALPGLAGSETPAPAATVPTPKLPPALAEYRATRATFVAALERGAVTPDMHRDLAAKARALDTDRLGRQAATPEERRHAAATVRKADRPAARANRRALDAAYVPTPTPRPGEAPALFEWRRVEAEHRRARAIDAVTPQLRDERSRRGTALLADPAAASQASKTQLESARRVTVFANKAAQPVAPAADTIDLSAERIRPAATPAAAPAQKVDTLADFEASRARFAKAMAAGQVTDDMRQERARAATALLADDGAKARATPKQLETAERVTKSVGKAATQGLGRGLGMSLRLVRTLIADEKQE